MSAPTDRLHDPNSLTFYAPKGPRAVRLGQVAEAAAALMPDAPPNDEERKSVPSAGAVFAGDAAIQRLRASRSLDPELVPAPPLPLRDRSLLGAIGRLVLVIAAAAIVALFVIGQLPFPYFRHTPASERGIELAAASSRPGQSIAAKQAEP